MVGRRIQSRNIVVVVTTVAVVMRIVVGIIPVGPSSGVWVEIIIVPIHFVEQSNAADHKRRANQDRGND